MRILAGPERFTAENAEGAKYPENAFTTGIFCVASAPSAFSAINPPSLVTLVSSVPWCFLPLV